MATELVSDSVLLERYQRQRQVDGAEVAAIALSTALARQPGEMSSTVAQSLLKTGDAAAAAQVLDAALKRYPDRLDLRLQLGQARAEAGEPVLAESTFRDVLSYQPSHEPASWALANLLREQGRLSAASAVIEALSLKHGGDRRVVLQCAGFLRENQRVAMAYAVCERALARGIDDAVLRSTAGQLALAIGRFDAAREHLLVALRQGADLNASFVMLALSDAQRYDSADHPDFARFEAALRSSSLNDRARASIHFARGKAFDDLGDYPSAAGEWRRANALVHPHLPWSAAAWQAFADQQMQARWTPLSASTSSEFTPVFIVGLPRTGSTLLADRLAHYPQVRNRGELNLIGYIIDRLETEGLAGDSAALREAANFYYAHVRQDDQAAIWYIDKNPLNFCHLGLISGLFPNARIIWCRRDRRDSAISIWSRFFAHRGHSYAYDAADILQFQRSVDRLMSHWRATLRLPIEVIDYQQLVTDSRTVIEGLASRLGMTPAPSLSIGDAALRPVQTLSAWQVRQPIYQHAIGRWRYYESLIPELLNDEPDAS